MPIIHASPAPFFGHQTDLHAANFANMHPALRLRIIMRPIMYAWRNQKVSGMVF